MKINFKKIIKLYFLYFSISISAIAGTTSYQITSPKVLIVSKTNEGQTLSTDMFLPGLRYKSSKDWWALSCNAYESEDENYKPCKISKTTLSVKRSSSSNRMGEDDTTGQMLHWQPSPPIGTLLMFKPSASILTKQVAGTVPTYYSNPEHALFTKEGSISTYVAGLLEAELILPGGIKARFLPVIVLSGKARSLTNDQIKGRHTLELRIGSKHQTLIGSNFDFYSRDYLQWAGDLDGDGQLDLLINANACTNKTVLFLSSMAKNNDLVGEAGVFENPSKGISEC